ncbi:MAG TPA: FliM/FliN family flagellar motor switch protein [Haliangiales bacterium]|nr:FliM/FliN family flagellar motor switch protein [Haliangiales bacterium]
MEPRLTPEELDAIQAAIAQSAKKPGGAQPAIDAVPVPLIADDRAAERARPNGLRIGNRWGAVLRERLGRMTSSAIDVEVVGAETVEAGTLREEIGAGWTRCIDVPGRPSAALVLVTGPIVDALAAVVLGGRAEGGRNARRPSAASMRLFERPGGMVCDVLRTAWREEQSIDIKPATDPERVEKWRREIGDDDTIVVVTLSVGEPTAGVVRLIARPETLVVPPAPFESIPAPRGAIEEALGGVPIEVRVELGKIRLSMGELVRLAPGTLIPLHKFVDDPLPVALAGKVKAHGRALVSRGVMAVEITEVEA